MLFFLIEKFYFFYTIVGPRINARSLVVSAPTWWMLASVPFPFLIPFCFHSRLLRFVFRIAFCSRCYHQRRNEGRPRTNTDPSSDTQE